MLVENLAIKSLITQRIVHDYMKANNVSAEDVEIIPTFRHSVKHGRQRYSTYLEEQKKSKFQNDRFLKWKQIQEEITAVNKKKAMLENTMAEEYALDAENVSEKEDTKTSQNLIRFGKLQRRKWRTKLMHWRNYLKRKMILSDVRVWLIHIQFSFWT